MRRFTSFFGITLLALLVSGWGNVLAATLCPHAMGDQARAYVEKAVAHRHESPQQEMGGMQMTPAASEAGHCGSKVAAFDQPAGICTHCFGQNESPATSSSLRELTLKKRDAVTIVKPAASAAISLGIVYTPQFLPTQNAPPGASNRKHLLLSVFLI